MYFYFLAQFSVSQRRLEWQDVSIVQTNSDIILITFSRRRV